MRSQVDSCQLIAAGRRAFTLIELLIVVAMLAILTVAFSSVVLFTIRGEVEEGLRATLRQEGLGVVHAILRDTQVAHRATDLLGNVRADTQTLILEMDSAERKPKRAVVYRREGPWLMRAVWDDTTASPTIHVLTSNVRAWQVERSGNLLRVKVNLAINRYTKDFTATYGFATRIGGSPAKM